MLIDPGEYAVFFNNLDILVPLQKAGEDFEAALFSETEPFGRLAWLFPDEDSSADTSGEALSAPLFEALSEPDTSQIPTARFQDGPFRYVSLSLDGAAAERLSRVLRFERIPVRQMISIVSQEAARFVLKAYAHAHWAEVSRYCGACGSPLATGHAHGDPGGKYCPACKRFFFPKISPAIIVLIRKGDSVLLAHNRKFTAGRFGLIAGFVEMGETLEETVHREVMEEAGIEIHNLRYVKSQPWPFPDSLMLAFEADYKSGTARPDGLEIDQLGWFTRQTLPEIPPKGSVARFLIERFFQAGSTEKLQERFN